MSEGGPKTEMMSVSKLSGDGPEVTLVVAIPNAASKRYPMRQATMTVGRSDQSDIPVKEASVSSKHGEFAIDAGAVSFRDLGSSNGTFVNDQRVQSVSLQSGDVVRLGNLATITVEIGGGAPRKAAAPPPSDNENPGSTAMISAADLDAMRRNPNAAPAAAPPRAAPAPAPRPRPAPPPPPMPMPVAQVEEEESGSKLPIIIGVAVVLVIAIGAGVFFFLKSAKHKKAVEHATAVEAQAVALLAPAANPCNGAEEKFREIVKDATDNPPPTGPYRPTDRPKNFKWVSAARDRASSAKRAGSIGIEPIRAAAAAAKTSANAIEEAAVKTKALEVAAALEARAQLGEEFVAAAGKLAKELDEYANLGESAYVYGKGDSLKEFAAFTLSKEPLVILKACKNGHDTNKTEVEEKFAQLKASIAE